MKSKTCQALTPVSLPFGEPRRSPALTVNQSKMNMIRMSAIPAQCRRSAPPD